MTFTAPIRVIQGTSSPALAPVHGNDAAGSPDATPARRPSARRPKASRRLPAVGPGEAGIRDALDRSYSCAAGLPLDPGRMGFVRGWLADSLLLLEGGERGAARYQATIVAKKLRSWGKTSRPRT